MRFNPHIYGNYKQTGLAYLAVLFLVAAIAVSMAVVTQNQDTQLKREKEQDWLYVGKQYQRAIASYYQLSPNGLKALPNSLDDLLTDKRFVAPVHHLRKAYLDPLTNQHWVQLQNEDNQIIGVVSTLQQAILSSTIVHTFQANQAGTITRYSDARFEFKLATDEALNTEEKIKPEANDVDLAQESSNLNAFAQE